MELNGTLIILLIPSIIPLTTVLNVSAIPSFIPVNIFPPVLNTSLTAVHAALNFELNQSTTLLKQPLIAPHTSSLKNDFTFANALLTLSYAPVNFSLKNVPTLTKTVLTASYLVWNQLPIPLNVVDIADHATLNGPLMTVPTVASIPFNAVKKPLKIPFIPSHAFFQSPENTPVIKSTTPFALVVIPLITV